MHAYIHICCIAERLLQTLFPVVGGQFDMPPRHGTRVQGMRKFPVNSTAEFQPKAKTCPDRHCLPELPVGLAAECAVKAMPPPPELLQHYQGASKQAAWSRRWYLTGHPLSQRPAATGCTGFYPAAGHYALARRAHTYIHTYIHTYMHPYIHKGTHMHDISK